MKQYLKGNFHKTQNQTLENECVEIQKCLKFQFGVKSLFLNIELARSFNWT